MAVDYSARYYKLAGVKECLYHPKLPTFRRIDMDTAAHKLPDHHCRTTTPCTRGEAYIDKLLLVLYYFTAYTRYEELDGFTRFEQWRRQPPQSKLEGK